MSVVEITPEQYHRDEDTTDDGRPTLSRSTAVRLIQASPLHVYHDHPKLRPTPLDEETADHLDIGTAVHALLLRGDMVVDVHAFPDWRTKAAREARDASRAAGRIPMLEHKFAVIEDALAAIRRSLDELELDPAPFTDGKAERVVVWEEPVSTGGTVTCRALVDWLRDDLAVIDDLKTTTTAHPRTWARRRMFEHGGDVQAAFYTRALEALGADPRPAFRFLVVETSPPFGVSVVVPDEAVLELGNRKVEWALRKWKACLDSGQWPGYGQRVHVATLPPWVENEWLDLELEEAGHDPSRYW